jgi:hypothetical protein
MKLAMGIFIFFIMSHSLNAQAQIGLEGISSGRYEIRKKPIRAPSSEKEAIIVLKEKVKVGAGDAKQNEKVEKNAEPVTVESKISSADSLKKEPTITDQAQSLFSEDATKINEYYRENLSSNDIRRNRLEIDILPTAVGIRSSSNYSFRDYRTDFSALQVNANMWLTPLIGLSGRYLFSLGADLDAISPDNSRYPAKFENLDLGVSFRRFMDSNDDESLEVNLLYGEEKLSIPNDATSRARL